MNQVDTPANSPKFRPRDAKTILVDASGYIFRAYYGLPSLTNREGRPTQATFGFLKMLGRLVQSVSPQRLVLAFDTAAPTFRKEFYSEYKANRPPPPEDLIPQFEDIHTLVDLLGIASVTMPGYEADDILATLAQQAKTDGQGPVLVVSSDKDLLQLVNDDVQVWDTLKNVIYNDDEVIKKMGVGPREIPDYLGLVGDSSDNIPGVSGIGRKSAITLIQSFGSIEQIFKHADQAPPRCIKKLKAEGALDQAIMSRTLARVCEDAPLPTHLKALWGSPRQEEALKNLLENLNIPAGLGRFPNSVPKQPISVATPTPVEAPAPQEAVQASAPELGHETFDHTPQLRTRLTPTAITSFRAIAESEIKRYEAILSRTDASSAGEGELELQLEALALMLDIFRDQMKEIAPVYKDDFDSLIEEIWLQEPSPHETNKSTKLKLEPEVATALENVLSAKPGCEFLGIRFQQLEERLLAEMSKEQALISAFKDKADPYEQMATIFFSLLPGMTTELQREQLRILHRSYFMDITVKATSAKLGWSAKRTRDALDHYENCFPALADFVENSKRRFKSDGTIKLLFGGAVAWSSDFEGRQSPGLVNTITKPIPAWASIQESCRQLCRIASGKAASILAARLDTEPIGHYSVSVAAFEIPQDQGDSLERLIQHEMTNTFELGIPLVVHPSRGQSLISI